MNIMIKSRFVSQLRSVPLATPAATQVDTINAEMEANLQILDSQRRMMEDKEKDLAVRADLRRSMGSRAP